MTSCKKCTSLKVLQETKLYVKFDVCNCFCRCLVSKASWLVFVVWEHVRLQNSIGNKYCIVKGGFAFWDVSSQKRKLLGTCNANDASQISWSPDSAWFLSSTQTPTLRVDNKLQLWKYNGLLKFEQKFDCLYQAIWRPVPSMPARPTSPVGVQEGQQQKVSQPATKAYIPPHMRGQQAQEQPQKKKDQKPKPANNKK